MNIKRIVLLTFLCFVSVALTPSNEPAPVKYWVFFNDKDSSQHLKTAQDIFTLRTIVSDRAIKRRLKINNDHLIHETDLPISQHYLDRISATGGVLVTISKWLNGASFKLTDEQLQQIARLDFVLEIRRVAVIPVPEPTPAVPEAARSSKSRYAGDVPQLYGASLTQIDAIGALDLHQAGITGKKVLIGMLDTGFNLEHNAIVNAEVIAEYDFINSDGKTSNEDGQDLFTQQNHGTNTFSTIAGYAEESLIGSAYDAQFALAKTEDNNGERAVEEDYWVAGLEWLDSIGVDIVSSSLGYTEFDDVPFYTQADMDGNTAVTTRAADIGASKGLLIVNSAGNEGNDAWGIINAPADGDSVLAVGAVTSTGSLALFSSRGPTADGRIKPDVVAIGMSVIVATAGTQNSYSFVNGTSFSCSLTAGAAALIMSAKPEVSAFEVMTALKETASRSSNPDNEFGWGIINTLDALSSFGPAFSNEANIENVSGGDKISTKVLSSLSVNASSVRLKYNFGTGSDFTEIAMTQNDETSFSAVIPASTGQRVRFFMSASDGDGNESEFPESGNIFTFVSGSINVQREEDVDVTIPVEFTLANNFPNPFNASTIITVGLQRNASVSLIIYDALGRHIKTLNNGPLSAGEHRIWWDGSNDTGTVVSSGIYFYRLQAPGFSETQKMVLIR